MDDDFERLTLRARKVFELKGSEDLEDWDRTGSIGDDRIPAFGVFPTTMDGLSELVVVGMLIASDPRVLEALWE